MSAYPEPGSAADLAEDFGFDPETGEPLPDRPGLPYERDGITYVSGYTDAATEAEIQAEEDAFADYWGGTGEAYEAAAEEAERQDAEPQAWADHAAWLAEPARRADDAAEDVAGS